MLLTIQWLRLTKIKILACAKEKQKWEKKLKKFDVEVLFSLKLNGTVDEILNK